ncbi:type II toxin-antitoxin system Phd/YefM family antitoxin [Methylocaldum sp. BRCS4]|jgi:prevent-host-death family protein|uniref:type II toxin-antitoxin system Phd/YefM family antitoxin n=1 Tax=Methylocaldum sp. GT1BB TaxID=3438963 RepID=UPI0012EC5347|nr:type II toxin-antitoxin system Phd/YefM family antitoxin [Methylocaldum sp. BRCS4]
MKTITAKEAKTRFGALLEQVAKEPIQITRSGRPYAYVLSVDQYKSLIERRMTKPLSEEKIHEILTNYCEGVISRHQAMRDLGVSWYGEVLDLMAIHGLQLKPVDPDVLEKMVMDITHAMGGIDE